MAPRSANSNKVLSLNPVPASTRRSSPCLPGFPPPTHKNKNMCIDYSCQRPWARHEDVDVEFVARCWTVAAHGEDELNNKHLLNIFYVRPMWCVRNQFGEYTGCRDEGWLKRFWAWPVCSGYNNNRRGRKALTGSSWSFWAAMWLLLWPANINASVPFLRADQPVWAGVTRRVTDLLSNMVHCQETEHIAHQRSVLSTLKKTDRWKRLDYPCKWQKEINMLNYAFISCLSHRNAIKPTWEQLLLNNNKSHRAQAAPQPFTFLILILILIYKLDLQQDYTRS